jgi:hypothetical protein
MTLKEIGLKERIARANGATPADAGKFFGWEPTRITKDPADFTQQELLERGWTKNVLDDVAEGYELITAITPTNPSAAGRAKQLRDIAQQCFE